MRAAGLEAVAYSDGVGELKEKTLCKISFMHVHLVQHTFENQPQNQGFHLSAMILQCASDYTEPKPCCEHVVSEIEVRVVITKLVQFGLDAAVCLPAFNNILAPYLICPMTT